MLDLRVLVVEDREDDALIIVHQLKKKGYHVAWRRVENGEEMRSALEEEKWDLVLADYSLPAFSAPEALAILRAEGYDLPFIIVSGAIDEATAVAAMEAGAHDFITKDNLLRLVPAIERELREAKQRRERKRSEDALRRSEARFRAVVDASIDALVSIDRNGTVTMFNKAASQMFGIHWTHMVGEPVDTLFAPEHREEANIFIVSHRSASPAVIDVVGRTLETVGLRKNGETFPLEMAVSRGQAGTEEFWLLVLRDISERKLSEKIIAETEAQLRLSQKMEAIGRLAGGVAHDFNNLLGAILGYVDVLCASIPEGDPLREDVDEIGRVAQRAADLTRQLLVFSRKQVVQPRVVDLNRLVTGSERMLRRLIGEDVLISVRLKADAPLLVADPAQLEQVVMNLVVNARDAMPTGGTLTVETRNAHIPADSPVRDFQNELHGDVVVLSVTDTGVGMTEEVRNHIFEPFFTTKAQGKGTGLGLSTVFGIVTQCNGVITVTSTPGEGSTFDLYFPLAPEETIGDDVTAADDTGEFHTAVHILVVEDEPVLRLLIARMLRSRGFAVREASDGTEALAIIQEQKAPIDLLITDVVMPKMNGRDLVNHLRTTHPSLRVLFMSGYADDTLIHHGMFEHGNGYIQKPFTSDALYAAIWKVMRDA